MSVNTYDFTILQGETLSKAIIWKDSEGVVVDLTGYTARMHLKRRVSDENPLFVLTTENGRINITALEGLVSLAVSATDTQTLDGSYVYDLELINGSTIKRLLQGTITVNLEVTK